MKTLKPFFSFSLYAIAFLLIFTSCEDKITQEVTYTANVPIYKPMSEVLSTINFDSPRELKQTGKIYAFGSVLYIGERGEGVHVFDNSDPKNPRNIGFLPIPGNKDIAIKGSFLYADCFTDLLVFKINTASAYELVNRVENVFNYVIPEYDTRYPLANIDPSKGVVMGYTIEDVTEVRKQSVMGQEEFLVANTSNFDQTARPSFGGVGESGARSLSVGADGIGGSFAQFMVVEDYLYVMTNESEINFYDIKNGAQPVASGSFSPGWGIETLFRNGDYLFIGGQLGMYIYSVQDPDQPVYLSEFNHAEACDPVVADKDYAYVTLRTGTNCMGQLNQLDVVDIKNINSPVHVLTVQMTNPHGVGIDPEKKVLFVCDGSDGLKVYNAENIAQLEQNKLQHIEGVVAYDVIPLNGNLLMIGEEGLYQFDYNNANSWLNLLSVIETHN